MIYELHIGTFSAEGTFRGAESRLDYLTQLGITAIEIMPVADFPGRRNWGYDGVLPYAPDASYGRPEDFKRLISAAHARGLMVILDVVYNHFGPEGNYLHTYAPAFFNPQRQTPWGAAINFDGAGSPIVRQFFIHNALYWLEEFHLDGLRLDAVHTISDDSSPDIVEDIGRAMREGPGRHHHVHLILENDRNQARYLRRGVHGSCECATAQWNDDLHHVLHVIATRESDGYYSDYAARPLATLARCLMEGFAYQGERSTFRGGAIRGEPSNHLPPLAFVDFLQTHDQVGNRAFGERLCHLAETLRRLLEAMRLPMDQDPGEVLASLERERCRRVLPYVHVARVGQAIPIEVALPDGVTTRRHRWILRLEDGRSRVATFVPSALGGVSGLAWQVEGFARRLLILPPVATMGYHRLDLEPADTPEQEGMMLIVAPARCYQPEGIGGDRRVWGPAARVSALRSRRNWGCGDFTDVKNMVDIAADAGAGTVGIHDLHAIDWSDPARAAPSPVSSRLFLNAMHLDVELLPDGSSLGHQAQFCGRDLISL